MRRSDRQNGARPASIQPAVDLGVVVEQLDEPAASRGDARVGGRAETAVPLERDHPHVGMGLRQPLGRPVRRGIVGHDHLDRQSVVDRAVPRDAFEASL